MLHIISYSYSPDNVPAAHRPYQLATYLDYAGISFIVHSRFGRHGSAGPSSGFSSVDQTSSTGKGFKRHVLSRLTAVVRPFLQIDKALPWALKSFPGALWMLITDRIKTRRRPVIWATCPLSSNLYFGGVLAWAVGAELHLDIRDQIDGINSKSAPWLTRAIIRGASTVTSVTPTLARHIEETGFAPPVTVIFNGVSAESLASSTQEIVPDSGWVEITYTGAVYGGDRPYLTAIEMLANLAYRLPNDFHGIRLTIAAREDLTNLPQQYEHNRFKIGLTGEVSKQKALMMAFSSEINLILVGSKPYHRCGIPLKTFDLLGAGRPILYFGPGDADAVAFLRSFALGRYMLIDSERFDLLDKENLRSWLLNVRRNQSAPKSEPSCSAESAKIARIIGVIQ